jgi:hypothetical protein
MLKSGPLSLFLLGVFHLDKKNGGYYVDVNFNLKKERAVMGELCPII